MFTFEKPGAIRGRKPQEQKKNKKQIAGGTQQARQHLWRQRESQCFRLSPCISTILYPHQMLPDPLNSQAICFFAPDPAPVV